MGTSDHINFICIQLLQKLKDNKARYTATLVACGWAGAMLEKVIGHMGRSCMLKKLKKR